MLIISQTNISLCSESAGSSSEEVPDAGMEEDDSKGQGRGQDPAENTPECPAPAVEDEEEDDDGFSFPIPPLAADACIVPVYPIFGRPPFPVAPAGEEREHEDDEPETATLRVPLGRLLLEEREFRARQQEQDGRSLSARHSQEEEDDEDEELEGVPPESYCLWAPGGAASAPASPRPRCRKSGSTGSVLRWRRISDRLVGRSHSDGKEKFVFLNAPPGAALHPPGPPGSKQDEQQEGSGKGDAAPGGVGWPLMYYGRGGGAAGGSGRRRSYLPYKQELVGLFANVSGLRRSYHPF